MYNSGVLMAKSLDRFVSSIHPSKFDDANRLPDGKWLWPVVRAARVRAYDDRA